MFRLYKFVVTGHANYYLILWSEIRAEWFCVEFYPQLSSRETHCRYNGHYIASEFRDSYYAVMTKSHLKLSYRVPVFDPCPN